MGAKGDYGIGTKIVMEYLDRFPNSPTLTLAKKIFTENKATFINIENVRMKMRRLRGQQKGSVVTEKKYIKDKPMSKNPFDSFPEGYKNDFSPFIISQSRVLVISDLHIPYHDKTAIKCALDYGLNKDANCILINGDLLDMPNHSRFEKDWRSRSTKEEFDTTRQFLVLLREMFPKARIIFKHGNHDSRYEKWLYVKAPEIFDDSYFHLEERLRLNDLKVEEVKGKRPIRIGKLNVLHGHEMAGGGGGVNPARGTFLKTLDSVLVGHYHKTSQNTESTLSGDVISVNSVGCLCDLNPDYMPINKFNLGFAYVDHDIKTGEYVLQNLKIVKGKVY